LDFFISYTSSDVSWAQWMDWVLRRNGYQTRVQVYDFEPDQNFVANIQKGLSEARHVLGLVSPAYLRSPWCTEEWTASLRDGKLMVALVAPCSPSGMLGTRPYVDLASLEEQAAEERLLAWVRALGGVERPAQRPAFPGKAQGAPRYPGTLPSLWNVARDRNRHFLGRDSALERLHEALLSGTPASLTQVLKGLGGVGKTALAIEYAYRYGAQYQGVWWLHAEDPGTLAADYAALGRKLGVELAQDQTEAIRAVRTALEQRAGLLLVFDNALNSEALEGYLPQGTQRRVLITSRAQYWPNAYSEGVDLLSVEEAGAFLMDPRGGTSVGIAPPPARAAAATRIAERLGRLPLALAQARAYMQASSTSLESYERLLETHGLKAAEKGKAPDTQQTVGTTWQLSVERLATECPAAVALLQLCSFLAPDDIALSDLANAAEHLPEPLSSALSDGLALGDLKAAVRRYSLLEVKHESVSVHRLVQEVIRTRLDAEQRVVWLQAGLRAMRQAFPDNPGDVRSWPECGRLLGHVSALTAAPAALEADANATGNLLAQAGVYYFGRAVYAEAEPLMRRALLIRENSFGADHPNVTVHLNNLAQLLKATNRLAGAEPLMRRALLIDENTFGADHPDVARDLNNLAALLQGTNRITEAEPLVRRALLIDENTFGADHPNVAVRLNNLAQLLKATDRLAEAEPLMRRALLIDGTTFGADHPEVAIDLNNLAQLLQATDRLAEAEPLMRRALLIDESSFGADHPKVAIDLNNLAALLRATKRLSEAEPLMRRGLSILEKSLGLDHPSTLMVRRNLEHLLRSRSGPGL
jgi:tetratricopeptide (TPR) repeat protein